MATRNWADPRLRAAGANMKQAEEFLRRETAKETSIDAWLKSRNLEATVLRDTSYEAQQLAEHKRLIELQEAFKKEHAKQKSYDRAIRDIAKFWGVMGSKAFTATQVDEYGDYIRIIALLQKYANQSLGRGYKQFALRAKSNFDRIAFYENAIKYLGRKGFTLWVNDSQAIPAWAQSPARMREYSKRMSDEAQIAIEYAFMETIKECLEIVEKISAGNVRAWPDAYSALIIERMNYILRNGLLFGVYDKKLGPALNNWRLEVDFIKLFGDPLYLEIATHYKAMIGEKIDKFGMTKDWSKKERFRATGKRVENLPYRDQQLLNTTGKRYLFWYAMASKRPIFYGGYKNWNQAAKGRRERWPKAIEKNEARIEKLQLDYLQRASNMDNDDKLIARANISDAKRKNQRLKTDINKKPRGIPIPRGAYEATINARVDFWRKRKVAPIWWYLEFGQVRWAPRIPPLGLTWRFLTKARLEIEKLAKQYWEEELSEAGTTISMKGGYPVTFRSTTTPMRRHTATGRLGSPFPRLNMLIDQTNRNAEEAARQAGVFHTPEPPIPQGWGDSPVPYTDYYEREVRPFTGQVERWTAPSAQTPLPRRFAPKTTFGRAVLLAGGRSNFNALSSTERGALFKKAADPRAKVSFPSSWKKRVKKTRAKKYKVNVVPEGIIYRNGRPVKKRRKKP